MAVGTMPVPWTTGAVVDVLWPWDRWGAGSKDRLEAAEEEEALPEGLDPGAGRGLCQRRWLARLAGQLKTLSHSGHLQGGWDGDRERRKRNGRVGLEFGFVVNGAGYFRAW